MIRIDACTPALRRFLERHRAETLNIAGILENEPGVEIFVDDPAAPEGVLVKGPAYRYLHTEDDGFLEDLFREMSREAGFYRFSGVWRPVADRIKARFPLVWDAPCELYLLPEGARVKPRPDSKATGVRPGDAEVIDAHYAFRNDHSLEKIRACIRERPSSAIYVEGKPACWLLVHEDNSLGIMYTLEEHRRKGFALDVSLDLVARQLAAGKTPFLQIRDDNGMSPGLARKCGFVPSGPCDWFGVMAGMPRELLEGAQAFRRRVLASLPAGEARSTERCLFRFLHALPGLAENPVQETARAADWLAFAERHLHPGVLRASVEALGEDCRLLCERRDGAIVATAALLVDDKFGCELLWRSNSDPRFIQNVLGWAKAHQRDVAFVRAAEEEAVILVETLGFRPIEA